MLRSDSPQEAHSPRESELAGSNQPIRCATYRERVESESSDSEAVQLQKEFI
jgi:hypothetical protein